MHVLDGGLATELEDRGHDLRDPLWSGRVLLEDPEALREVHQAYREAGATILCSASYQTTHGGLAERGLDRDRADALLRRSVELAREAAGDEAWVAASIGPHGAARHDGSEYTGDYDLDEGRLREFHRPRIAALAGAGPDLFAAETIPLLREARAIAAELEEAAVRGWVSLYARDETRLGGGDGLLECARALDASDAVLAIGVNCVAPELVEPALRELRRGTAKPLVAYPNSGEGWDAAAHRWTGTGRPAHEAARRWRELGAVVIGGCCRIGPEAIASLARALS